jgi:hypothetical protein
LSILEKEYFLLYFNDETVKKTLTGGFPVKSMSKASDNVQVLGIFVTEVL